VEFGGDVDIDEEVAFEREIDREEEAITLGLAATAVKFAGSKCPYSAFSVAAQAA
jgi:hypothetical protein